MTITVYYTEHDNVFVYPPEPVLKNLPDRVTGAITKCPSFLQELKNTFLIRAPFYYELEWDGEQIRTDIADQSFFNTYVAIRDTKTGFCSFLAPKMYFFAEKPLVMQLKSANYHANEFTKNITLIEGSYDIGRHFRKVEAAFFMDGRKITIERGEPLYYLKFLTEEKINFSPFQFSKNLKDLIEPRFELRKTKFNTSLDFWYQINDNFYGKKILKHIKQSLL